MLFQDLQSLEVSYNTRLLPPPTSAVRQWVVIFCVGHGAGTLAFPLLSTLKNMIKAKSFPVKIIGI